MRKIPLALALVLGWLPALVNAQGPDFTITAYGALADGQTDNAAAIQQALDAAAAKGGGRVVVPAGRFVTGPLLLRSNTELHLDRGATLLGSTHRLDYGTQSLQTTALLTATGQQNIAITGQGTIDGRGREVVQDLMGLLKTGILQDPEWQVKRPLENSRPFIVEFTACRQVRVTGVTIKDAACWVQIYRECVDVQFDSIKVKSTAYWNNDGIDLVDCQRVTLANSSFDAADDGICLKSENLHSRCEDISVRNCTVRSSASGFKLGTASWGGFKNIRVDGLKVYDTFRSAIALETVDGAVLEDIDIRNVTATNTGNAIFLRLGHRRGAAPGALRRVYIGNVKAEIPTAKPDKGYELEGPVFKEPHNINPSSIVGLPGHPVQDVTLENIDLTYVGGNARTTANRSLDSLATVPERPKAYPEFSMFGELPAYGVYARHATGLTLKNVRVRTQGPDYRPAFVFDDVQKLTLHDVAVPAAPALPLVALQNVTGLTLSKLTTPVSRQKAVRVLLPSKGPQAL